MRILLAVFGLFLLTACNPSALSAKGLQIYGAQLSPDAAKAAVIVIDRTDRSRTELLIYDISRNSFQELPRLETGWYPHHAAFSSDNSLLAVSAVCPTICSDDTDLSRLMLFSFKTGQWRTVVSGDGWRSEPVFLPGDNSLLYKRARLLVTENRQMLAIEPQPAIAEIATGEETAFSVNNERYYSLSSPSIGADGAIYFWIVAPSGDVRDAFRQAYVEHGKDGSAAIDFPVRLPVSDLSTDGKALGLPELAPGPFHDTGPGGISNYLVSGDGQRRVFKAAMTTEADRFEEVFFVVENGVRRQVLSTQILGGGFSISHDGRKALLKGDAKIRTSDNPQRSPTGWDLFLLDLDSGEIQRLPVREWVEQKAAATEN